MIKFVALDIALLLDPELDALCRRLNTSPLAEPFSDFRKCDNYPHITLAMGVFREQEIQAISTELQFAAGFLPLAMHVNELYRKVSEQIGQEYQLLLRRNQQLTDIHCAIMYQLRPYMVHMPSSPDMFVVDADEAWELNTTYWVDGFRYKTPEDYKPHISLKCRNASLEVPLPIHGRADKIVIARIGNYCSCRQILREVHR